MLAASAVMEDEAEFDAGFTTAIGRCSIISELVFCGTNGQAQFLSTADGKPTKTLEFDGESIFSAVVADKTLYVLTDQAQLYAWR